jgi:hypothetical protein
MGVLEYSLEYSLRPLQLIAFGADRSFAFRCFASAVLWHTTHRTVALIDERQLSERSSERY